MQYFVSYAINFVDGQAIFSNIVLDEQMMEKIGVKDLSTTDNLRSLEDVLQHAYINSTKMNVDLIQATVILFFQKL